MVVKKWRFWKGYDTYDLTNVGDLRLENGDCISNRGFLIDLGASSESSL